MSKTKHGRRYTQGGRLLRSQVARALVRARDGDACHLCGEVVHEGFVQGDKRQATLDHLTERAAGGGSDLGNMRLSHRGCNESRGQAFDTERRMVSSSSPALARLLDIIDALLSQGLFSTASIDHRASR
jgi:5-methylcytosine-specific restriction endonuclease McrA